MKVVGGDEDGPMAETALNLQAGVWLRRVREEHKPRKWSGEAFARLLSAELKIVITDGALYNWEAGKRTVPAAIVLAASKITSQPIAMDGGARKRLLDELLDELEKRLGERKAE